MPFQSLIIYQALFGTGNRDAMKSWQNLSNWAHSSFFTLSCADKRWDENFVSILRQKGLQVIYRKKANNPQPTDAQYSYQADDIWIKQEGQEEVILKEIFE